MSAEHTPGPWCVEDPMGADVGLWIVQSGLEPYQWSCIAMVCDDEDGTARDEGGRFIGRTEQEANAHLIAAAPELLDGCNALLGLIQLVCDRDDMPAAIREALTTSHRVEEANGAIAKAEGRS